MEDLDIIKTISEGYNELFGHTETEVIPLPDPTFDRRTVQDPGWQQNNYWSV